MCGINRYVWDSQVLRHIFRVPANQHTGAPPEKQREAMLDVRPQQQVCGGPNCAANQESAVEFLLRSVYIR